MKSEEVSIRSVLAEMNRKLDRVLAVVDKPTKPAYTYSQEQVVANLALRIHLTSHFRMRIDKIHLPRIKSTFYKMWSAEKVD